MRRYPIEVLLRPIFEFPVAMIAMAMAIIMVMFHEILLLSRTTSIIVALLMLGLSYQLFYRGFRIYRYQKGLFKLPFYQLKPKDIPVSDHYLFLGKGFKWTQDHIQRLEDTKRSKNKQYLEPPKMYETIRKLEKTSPLCYQLFHNQSFFNPYKPLPDVGGDPKIHAVGLFEGEQDIFESLTERVGHKLVEGTTRVGKTRLAEIFITQDIRRGDTTIVFDPKGDADLMLRTYIEAKRVDRPVYVFHLGYPDISCRYNAIGSFTKITEVAGRISDQLPADGNSAVFRDFAWGFINIVAKALVRVGEQPDYIKVKRYVNNINPLIKLYAERVLYVAYPDSEQSIARIHRQLESNSKGSRGNKDFLCLAVAQYAEQYNIEDDDLDGILTVFKYDGQYYSKLIASLRPLLDKLTSGQVSDLLAPSDDPEDKRPIIDWTQVIRQNAVVYVGLDALTDATVAHAIGAAMFADLTSVAGKIYKFGKTHGMPDTSIKNKPLSIHADEFNELLGEQFIPMINKAGGAGYQVTGYTQSMFDVETGIGSKAKAGMILDNFNTLIMLRVKSEETANLLISKVPEYEVHELTVMAQATDSAQPNNDVAFTSAVRESISSKRVSAVTVSDMMNMPKGQAFALIEGAQLYKLRLPLAKKEMFDKNSGIPNKLSEMAERMKKDYSSTMDLRVINTPIALNDG